MYTLLCSKQKPSTRERQSGSLDVSSRALLKDSYKLYTFSLYLSPEIQAT